MDIAVLEYVSGNKRPFSEWMRTLDTKAAGAVEARIARLRAGNLGDWKSVGDGVFEMRIDLGPGYRVYFGRHGRTVVVLLGGGSKRSQSAEIKRAKENWSDYEKS